MLTLCKLDCAYVRQHTPVEKTGEPTRKTCSDLEHSFRPIRESQGLTSHLSRVRAVKSAGGPGPAGVCHGSPSALGGRGGPSCGSAGNCSQLVRVQFRTTHCRVQLASLISVRPRRRTTGPRLWHAARITDGRGCGRRRWAYASLQPASAGRAWAGSLPVLARQSHYTAGVLLVKAGFAAALIPRLFENLNSVMGLPVGRHGLVSRRT